MRTPDPTNTIFMSMIAGPSAAIESSELAGQQDLVSQVGLTIELPTQGLTEPAYGARPAVTSKRLAGLGIIIGEPVADDPLFTKVTVPTGWKLRPTNHSMWSDLVDEHGRVRAGIFYKAAYYDRKAHMGWRTRYRVDMLEYRNGTSRDTEVWTGVVMDGDTEIHRCEPCSGGESYKDETLARTLAIRWLADNYPDYQDPFAYWT